MTQRPTIVVLSGGLDSTVCMAGACERNGSVVALTFDYGQRHRIELERARAVASHYGVEHLEQRLDLGQWGGSALTDDGIAVPESSAGSATAIPLTYVPGRNLIFLAMAAALAEVRDARGVILGVNALDYSGYPDCRPEFVESFRETAALALRRGVEGDPIAVDTPLLDLTKADIVRLGVKLGAPLHLTWSCYRGGPSPCGTCDACVLRSRGFAEAGHPDPGLHA